MTIQQLFEEGIKVLEEGNIQNPMLDTQLLLSYALDVDKVYIYTHRDRIIEGETVDNFLSLLNKRKTGYPLQYILGDQEFMGLNFKVGEGVLVPRPDTETLVEWIIEVVKSKEKFNKNTINILDIGTGSGAITLSLAYYLENARIYSVDISEKAHKIAKVNTKKLGLESRVTLLKGNLFEPIKELNKDIKFDIIVSNPPYIPSDDIDTLQKEVSKYEPRLALDGGADGLDFYRKIILGSPEYLKNKGVLGFEIGYNQGSDLKRLLEEIEGFNNIRIRKDLAGKERAVIANWEKSN
ncbi:MAG: peptide chain release factor N(5)-glutamine methyltransferase [Firmicutes bacterium]|nr:peptide chain release factor N(5)-glutamine methyltransferase [Bacillota bacterium]